MLQYIVNLTAIWLISLVVFDVLHRKESYHGYNRFYLVATFIAGIAIPLCRWEHSIQPAQTLLRQPMAHIITAGKEISGLQEKTGNYNWLLGIYVAGACIAAIVLLADVVKLTHCYIKGKKTKQAEWTIVETHKEHAPFSFLNTLFISSNKLYNSEEWEMLLMHEYQHTRLLHFADVAALELARIVLWFHPLVYIYHSRLRLVHEYQADMACLQPPRVYGKFLVDQMLLQATPAVTHALSNAPVKKRILMLGHKSPPYRKLAHLAIFPLIGLFMVCFTRYDIGRQHVNYAPAYTGNISSTQLPAYTTDFVNEQDQIASEEKKQSRINGALRVKKDVATGMEKKEKYGASYKNVVTLAGMENNTNAQCCSANLLWGNNYCNVVSQNFAASNPVSLAEYAGNSPCTQGFDAHRIDRYKNTVEDYKQVQESWGEYVADNIFTSAMPARMTQVVVMNDPWSVSPEKGPGMVPPLSIDRSLFGPNEKTIFGDAVAMACPVKNDVPERLQFSTFEQKSITLKTKSTKTKNTAYAP